MIISSIINFFKTESVIKKLERNNNVFIIIKCDKNEDYKELIFDTLKKELEDKDSLNVCLINIFNIEHESSYKDISEMDLSDIFNLCDKFLIEWQIAVRIDIHKNLMSDKYTHNSYIFVK